MEINMNNVMEYKGYYGTVEFSADDNVLFGKVLGINGLISFEGDNLQNLKKDFEDAIDDYLEMCDEKGVEPERSYKGDFNIIISPELHKTLAFYSVSRGQSLDYTVEEALKYYLKTS
jgi:predicted HicB family RNase H-like nuclease